MFSFESFLNLPLIWGGLIATAIFLYVLLDGFDLGVGILFPFAPSEACRNKLMNSIAPFWDGNETWLVLGGGGLFAAFPLAYAILMPAFYMPIMVMLLGLIFRGVAFEFRFKATARGRKLWDYAFHFGSLIASFCQGVMLGTFVQGVSVQGRVFSGAGFDWFSPFALMTGAALVFGYALLGATWLVMKTDDQTQKWARSCAKYVAIYVIGFMGLVCVWVPSLNHQICHRWFSMPNLVYLAPIPLLTIWTASTLFQSLARQDEAKPFLMSILLFALGYAGLAVSLWPWVVPYQVSLRQAAAAPESLSLLLVGVVLFLPCVLGYTAYSYYVFRGKSHADSEY
ncbi:cytochrome d ubiquinol oxidase subunit II [Candidatus Finniella inopinata]|uniref:Cytochrome d ubiquinol oxidase subunit II n=1 Tax=Candidatus Finniella inopinata TaxID=1696036 RepID=A0A4Q7DGX8_9PROT|nr:cytochrome d ubiquinol oxidase subunit II [Candidatus Finniella inopinata]RZI45349.1 cytochrome d ubiquinol oxidase subunit II [Candidatus Finniella inopinata]